MRRGRTAGRDLGERALTWPPPSPPPRPRPRPAGAAAEPAAPAPPSREERARAYFTDTLLLDQDGRAVRFYSDVLQGNVVVVDFIFTRCTGACPSSPGG